MQADWQIAPHSLKDVQVVTAIAEIVFAVYLDPVDGWHRLEEIGVVHVTQSDTDAGRRAKSRAEGIHANRVPTW
jgi:hypothetical protein